MTNHLQISDEQALIVSTVKDGFNVSVNAVAGAGKTTTILFIAKMMRPKKVLVITYNRRIMDETKETIQKWGLDNIEIRTYHSLSSSLYVYSKTDAGIIEAVQSDMKSRRQLRYDAIIVDECQDCMYLYFKFVIKVLSQNSKNAQIVFLGDFKQNIYKFKGTDSRFLTLANKIINNGIEWKNLKLSVSYRLTPAVAAMINACFLREEVIVGGNTRHKNIKPEYHMINMFNEKLLMEWVVDFKNMIEENGYSYDEVFILASSITQRGNVMTSIRNPITRLENALVASGIKCNAVTNDDEQLNEKTMKNKLVLSTIHGAKGLERKVVILFGVEDFYYNLGCNKNDPRRECPNKIYVGLTRSLEKLIIVHNTSSNYMPFIDKDRLSEFATIKKYGIDHPLSTTGGDIIQREFSCREFIKHIREEWMLPFEKYKIPIQGAIDKPLVTYVETENEEYENVSDIVGVGIVEYAVMPILNMIRIKDIVQEANGSIIKIPKIHMSVVEKEINKFKKIQYMLKLANIYLSYCEHGFMFKIAQLNRYDFVTQKEADTLAKNLRSKITADGEQLVTEKSVCTELELNGFHLIINGRIDIIDKENKTIWEVKCKQSLDSSDFLQLIIYAVSLNKPDYKYKLINLFSDEVIELKYDKELKPLLTKLAKEKLKDMDEITDEEFIEMHSTTITHDTQDESEEDALWDNEDIVAPIDFHSDSDEDNTDMQFENIEDEKDNSLIMVFDTETTGTKDSRIVSICWKLFRTDGTQVFSKYHMVKPDNFIVGANPFAQKVHKITHEKASLQGVEMPKILDQIEENIKKVTTIVAHSITHDVKHLLNEAKIYEKNSLFEAINTKEKFCTMRNAREIVKAKDIRGRIKMPSLAEVYDFYFETPFREHHAQSDVEACAKCYFKLKPI